MKRKFFFTSITLLPIIIALVFIFFPATLFSAANSLSDDFNSMNTANWEKADGWTNGDPFYCTWRSNNVNFRNGQMELSITKDSGSIPYAGGEYRTKNFYHYGRYEVSMKPAKNTGIVSSFFTYTGPSDDNPWDEIDIEFLGKDTTIVQFNYYTNGAGNHEYIHKLGFDASTSFHRYAFEWQKDYIAWFVDSKEVYRATSNIPKTPGKIMMNLWPGTGVDSWLGYYNGNTPIYAYYDSMSYNPLASTTTPQTTNKPTPEATPGNTPETTQTSSTGRYNIEYKKINDWGTGATINMKITNESNTPKNGWEVSWNFSGNQKITNVWGANFNQNGNAVTISNTSYNSQIPAGGSVEVGFNITYSGTNENPTSFNIK
jgi:endo-1,3-1,4-beta-glycanase ExoK